MVWQAEEEPTHLIIVLRVDKGSVGEMSDPRAGGKSKETGHLPTRQMAS